MGPLTSSQSQPVGPLTSSQSQPVGPLTSSQSQPVGPLTSSQSQPVGPLTSSQSHPVGPLTSSCHFSSSPFPVVSRRFPRGLQTSIRLLPHIVDTEILSEWKQWPHLAGLTPTSGPGSTGNECPLANHCYHVIGFLSIG